MKRLLLALSFVMLFACAISAHGAERPSFDALAAAGADRHDGEGIHAGIKETVTASVKPEHSQKDKRQREMKVTGIAVHPVTNAPVVFLEDVEKKEVLPIVIGFLEAFSIASVLEKVNTPRPMTHDLMKNVLDKLGAKVVRIEVNDVRLGTYYALIHLETDKRRFAVDSRPSDAIAIALRHGASIFVEESVIERSELREFMTRGDSDGPAAGARRNRLWDISRKHPQGKKSPG